MAEWDWGRIRKALMPAFSILRLGRKSAERERPPPPLPRATTRGPATFLNDLHQPTLTKI